MSGRTSPVGLGGQERHGPEGWVLGQRAFVATRSLFVQVALVVGVAAVWLWLAADGRLHWDEPDYLYTAAYLSTAEILAGDFQPSGIQGFSVSRVGHVLLVKAVVALLGPGTAALALIITCYLLMLAAFLGMAYLILRRLMPSAPNPDVAVALCVFMPICIYLACKTVAEIPAALLASLAVWGLLGSLRSRPVLWLAVTAVALAGVALTKNHVALLYTSFVAALLISPLPGYRRGRVVAHAIAAGVGAVALFFVVLAATGISLNLYLAPAATIASLIQGEPFEARLLALTVAGGLYFLALPLAFLSPRRAEARFFAIWFALATLPLLASPRLEERYLVTNLIALAGLVHLSIDGLTPLVRRWWTARLWAGAVCAGLGAAMLVGSAAVAQMLSMHEVRMGQLRTVLSRLDDSYGRGGYALLTPQEGTIFLYLRFVDPALPVYTVLTPRPPDHRDAVAWAAFQNRYYESRALHTLDELAGLGAVEMVYVSFDESFPVANLRRLAEHTLPPALRQRLEQRLAKMNLLDHLGQSWMWAHPEIEFRQLFKHGHYIALRAEISPEPGFNR